MAFIFWVLMIALGGTLAVLGTLPLGRFPSFASEVAVMRRPYGNVLGGVILLFVVSRLAFHLKGTGLIVFAVILVLTALVCLVLSLSEKVK